VRGIDIRAFVDELMKIAQSQLRDPDSPWGSPTVEAPRAIQTRSARANAPQMPTISAPVVRTPAARFGPRHGRSGQQESSPLSLTDTELRGHEGG